MKILEDFSLSLYRRTSSQREKTSGTLGSLLRILFLRDCMDSSSRDSLFMLTKVTGNSLTVFAIMFLISQSVLRVAIMESSKTSIFL